MGETFSILNNRQPVVFFDGMCNLCNGFVQFLIRNDPQGLLSFASIQSEVGKALLEKYPYLHAHDSVILFANNEVKVKSDAALDILTSLNGWKWARVLRVFPLRLRNWVYGLIAKNRYRVFGRKQECMIPTPELKSRFIS